MRIAGELGIKPPVARHEGLSDERKLHLAVGLNMRRRHLDADRRRSLVRKLNTEEHLSVRKIADITGWSKSTVDRDLQSSPFEETLRGFKEMGEQADQLGPGAAQEFFEHFSGLGVSLFSWADQEWKQGRFDDVKRLEFNLSVYTMSRTIDIVRARAAGTPAPAEPIDWQSICGGCSRPLICPLTCRFSPWR